MPLCCRTSTRRYEHLIITRVKNILNDEMLKNLGMKGDELHSLYVQDYDEAKGEMVCINSWGPDPDYNPNPVVELTDATHYYEVDASAVPSSFQKVELLDQKSTPEEKMITTVKQSDFDIMDKIIKDWNKDDVNDPSFWPSKQEVESAGRLVWAGLIDSLKFMRLRDMDISDMPSIVLAKLTRAVTERINVKRVTGDISPILLNLVCDTVQLEEITITERSLPPEIKVNVFMLGKLKGDTTSLINRLRCNYDILIYGMTLSSEETKCILGYLNTTTGQLSLWTGAQCDFNILSSYDGTCRCMKILFTWDVHGQYASSIRSMLRRLGWRKVETDDYMYIERPTIESNQTVPEPNILKNFKKLFF